MVQPSVEEKKSTASSPDKLTLSKGSVKGAAPEAQMGQPEVNLQQIEALVNDQVRANADAATKVMSYDDAVAAGAMALFGEK